MNVKFLIPVVVEELTDNCLSGYDLDWKNLILVDNSPDQFAKKYVERGAIVHSFPSNIGVSASWNIGIRSDADFLFIISQSIIFNKGFSEIIANINKADEYGLMTQEGWHCIGFTRKTFDIVGEFDETFYPGYYEDNDYAYRMKLVDIHGKNRNLPKVQLSTACQGNAMAIKSGKIVNVRFDLLGQYFVKKWGGYPGNEKFITPFNK
jgi:hypothetical protein